MMKTRLVVATREPEATFFTNAATGRSISVNKQETGGIVTFDKIQPLEVRLFAENTRGLPAVYNQAIREAVGEDLILVFAHDDVLFLDYFWTTRVQEGLEKFDLVGLAGNKRRVPRQPAWAFVDSEFTWDDSANLSGIVGQGQSFSSSSLYVFGPSRQKVKLLDGLLLAIKTQTLRAHELWFDERFDFNHYDLDFCRQLEEKGLSCGTWDISVVHQSYGAFHSDSWKDSSRRYLEKWND